MRHLLAGENMALVVGRAGSATGDKEWNIVFVAAHPVDFNIFRRGGGQVCPLYLYPDSAGKQGVLMPEEGRTANLSEAFLKALAGVLGQTPVPEAVLGYLYAMLHSPTYRARYAEFLKRDFPRVPLPPNKRIFIMLALLGGKLIDLHLLRHHELNTPSCKYPVPGDNRIECIEYDEKAQRVWINEAQYFEPLPPEVWAYRVGGYQVCKEWLDARKGTQLSLDEREAFQKMVTALERTLELQKEIDAVVRQAWGW
jgi:predicted helicase